jgi:hypothetical protein
MYNNKVLLYYTISSFVIIVIILSVTYYYISLTTTTSNDKNDNNNIYNKLITYFNKNDNDENKSNLTDNKSTTANELKIESMKNSWSKFDNPRSIANYSYSNELIKSLSTYLFNDMIVYPKVSLNYFHPELATKNPASLPANVSLLRYATTLINRDTNEPVINIIPNYHTFPIDVLAKYIRQKSPKAPIIWVDGEPDEINTKDSNLYDIILTTKKELEDEEKGIFFVPYFVLWLLEINKKSLDNDDNNIIKPINQRSRFIDFVYGNCNEEMFEGVRERTKILKAFESNNIKVSKLGVCGNDEIMDRINNKDINKDINDMIIKSRTAYLTNHILYKDTKFVIAVENTFKNGYITEKLTAPLLAGAVPIYLGAPDVASYINEQSFINVRDFSSYDDLVDHVINMTDDDINKIINITPKISSSNNDNYYFTLLSGGEIYQKIAKKLYRTHRYTLPYLRPLCLFDSNIIFALSSLNNKYKDLMSEVDIINSYGYAKTVKECDDQLSEMIKSSTNNIDDDDIIIWSRPWGVIKLRDILRMAPAINENFIELLYQISIRDMNSGNCSFKYKDMRIYLYAGRKKSIINKIKNNNYCPVDIEIFL